MVCKLNTETLTTSNQNKRQNHWKINRFITKQEDICNESQLWKKIDAWKEEARECVLKCMDERFKFITINLTGGDA